VVARQAGKNRTVSAVWAAIRAAAASFGRLLRQLWLEVTGFVFLAIAAIGAYALVREYDKYRAGLPNGSRLGLAICFTLLFAWFGLSSFWRAGGGD